MERNELLGVLTALRPALSEKEIFEGAGSFAFDNKQAITFNDEISVRHPLDLGFEGTVPADKLLAFLNKARAGRLEVDAEDGELRLKCGRAKAGIPMTAEVPDHLSTIKVPRKGWSSLPDGFAEAVRFCLFSAGRDMTKPALTCLHILNGHAESCDQYRATQREYGSKFPSDIALLIPATAARHIHGFGAVDYVTDIPSWIHFRNEAKAVLSCRLFAGDYPDLSELLDTGQKGKRIKFPDGLADALDGAGAFADAEFDTDRQVGIRVKDGRMRVRAEGQDGWYEETVRAKGIKDLEFTIHPGFLQEILAHSGEAKLLESAMLFEGDGFVHVVSL